MAVWGNSAWWFWCAVPSYWDVMLGIFSHICCPFVCLLWRDVFSSTLPTFFFHFFAVLGFELWASPLLGRCSVAWATHQPFFVLSIFEIGSQELFTCAGLGLQAWATGSWLCSLFN
jgi:hypothetical protein